MLMIAFMSHMQGTDSGEFSRKVAEVLRTTGIDLFKIFGDQTVWVIRKMAHMTEYGILYILVMIPLWKRVNGRWIALVISVLYAASDEIHQGFIPGRVASILDVCFDSLGAVVAFGITGLWAKIFGRK